jgi:hypothetical protein
VADRVSEIADRLYSLPLDEFTSERDAAAKALRREKERDAAAEVGKLPKPSAGAWAVNAIAREQPDLRDELLAAGEALRDAQDSALAGEGPRALRDATARERAAVDAMLAAAAKLSPGGRKLSGTALDKLRQTLHAAASDDDVRAAIAAGRLVRDAEGGGAWAFGIEAPPPKPARKRTKARDKADETDKADEAERAAREQAEREEAERRREIEAQLKEANAERRARERELDRAERAAERARERLERAEEAAAEAREHVDEAESELESARDACRRARDDAARLEEQLD